MNKSKKEKVVAKTDGKELVASGKVPEHEPFAAWERPHLNALVL